MSYKKRCTFTAIILVGILGVLGGIATDVRAAESTTYSLDGDVRFAQDEARSNTYELRGHMYWHAENMQSDTFQLTSDGGDGTTEGASGGSSTGGSSGGSDTTHNAPSGGGRRTTLPHATDGPGSLPIGRVRAPIMRPAAPATSMSAPEGGHVATIDTVDETSPTSAAAEVNGVRGGTDRTGVATTAMNDAAREGGIMEAVRSSNVTKAAITIAQAATVMRLGYIYRFESLFEALPAYSISPAAIRTMSLAVRPGSIAVDSLLWPFAWLGKVRRKKRRTNEEAQD